jgi:flagellar export protein FliJ
MKGFHFRMDPILQLRAAQLDACRAELEADKRRCEESAKLLRDAEQRFDRAAALLEASLSAGTTGERLRSAAGAQADLRAASRSASATIESSESRLAAARERLVEAWKTMRSLELLKEHSAERWQRENRVREQRATDEVALRSPKR